MTTDQSPPIELPQWLTEAILEGDSTDALLNKRHEERTISALYCMIERDGNTGAPLTAQVYNVSPNGMGMITRKPLTAGQCIKLAPGDDSDGAPVRAVVVHCTQTVQGYKVGCSFQTS